MAAVSKFAIYSFNVILRQHSGFEFLLRVRVSLFTRKLFFFSVYVSALVLCGVSTVSSYSLGLFISILSSPIIVGLLFFIILNF